MMTHIEIESVWLAEAAAELAGSIALYIYRDLVSTLQAAEGATFGLQYELTY